MKTNKKLILLIIMIIIVIFLLTLFGLTRPNNTDKFNAKTYLSEEYIGFKVDVSNKTEAQTVQIVNTALNEKTLKLYQNGDVVDVIPLSKLVINHNIEEAVSRVKNVNDELHGFDKLKEHTLQITISYAIDENTISNDIIKDLNCLKNETESKDAYLTTQNYEMIIESGDTGTVISEEKLISYIVKEFNKGNLDVNLDEGNLYVKPDTSKGNKELTQKAEIFNNTVNTKFTYIFDKETITIPKETIFNWISLSDSGKIVFDDNAMLEYVKSLSKKYNTTEMKRTFVNHNGDTITIPHASYGWEIDEDKEVTQLQSDLKKGGTYEREPEWKYTGWKSYKNESNNDFGNSYIEVSLDEQTLWLYIDGNVILETPIVTGANGETPRGAYMVIEKKRDSEPIGDGEMGEGNSEYILYFDEGYAIHDTQLRVEYGKDFYKTEGTKGCINVPEVASQRLYENTDVCFPVIIY